MPAAAKRRLVAILAADVAGYSRLMGENERATLDTLNAYRAVFRDHVNRHEGRVVDTAGDSVLAVFESVVEAVECAVEVQAALARDNTALAEERRMLFRIGVNLGDVIEQADGTIYGDGVNVAARLENLAEPGGITISDSAHMHVRGKLDIGFVDLGEHDVKNIANPVRAYGIAMKAHPAQPKIDPVACSDRPSLAVLPLDNLSGDTEQQHFCDGVAEDLTTALSRFDWLFVVARNAAFSYKGQPVDVKRVGRELGVRYVLEGSVRSAGSRARVNIQLIETDRQGHVWADRLDADMADPFEAQDEIVARVASTVAPEVIQSEVTRAVAKANTDLDTWDHYLLGLRGYFAMTDADLKAAITHLDKAIEAEPSFAMAYAQKALCHAQAAVHGWTRPARDGLRLARELVNAAIRTAPASPEVNQALACILMYTGQAHQAVTAAQRSVELNPNYADAYAVLGHALILCGKIEEGINACHRALKSTPRDFRGSWLLDAIGHGYFFRGEYEKAIELSNKGLQRDPGLFGALVTLACANARLGRRDEAKRAIDQLLADIPRYSLSAVRKNPMFVDPKLVEELIDSLRLAGLPE